MKRWYKNDSFYIAAMNTLCVGTSIWAYSHNPEFTWFIVGFLNGLSALLHSYCVYKGL